MAERSAVNRDVAGSIPAVGAASTSEPAPGCSLWMVGRAAECTGLENQSLSRGPGFESRTIRQAELAQWIERGPPTSGVAGSNPAFGTGAARPRCQLPHTSPRCGGFAPLAHQVEQRPCKPQVARSSRAGGSMQERRRTRGRGGRPEMGAHHHRGWHGNGVRCVSGRTPSDGGKPSEISTDSPVARPAGAGWVPGSIPGRGSDGR